MRLDEVGCICIISMKKALLRLFGGQMIGGTPCLASFRSCVRGLDYIATLVATWMQQTDNLRCILCIVGTNTASLLFDVSINRLSIRGTALYPSDELATEISEIAHANDCLSPSSIPIPAIQIGEPYRTSSIGP